MMTTLATDGITLAADSQITSGETIESTSQQKVFRLGDGRVIGYAGCLASSRAFHEWMVSGADTSHCPVLSDEFMAVVIDGTSTAVHYDASLRTVTMPTPYAAGTGRDFALAAMDAGKSPTEAVAIAIGRDVWSGGRVRSLKVR